MIKESKLDVLKRYIFMIIGCILYGFSLRIFLIPHNIVGGGVSGAASLIEILTGLDASIFIIAINVPIILLGLKLMGLKFIIRCLITTGTLSLATYLINFLNIPNITDQPILATLYGGVLQGIAIGLFIRFEMSSGGTELLGRVTHHVLPYGSIAVHTAILDGIVVIVGAICLNNLENILYALILIFVSAKLSDMIVLGLNKAKVFYIVTEKADEISEYLIAHSPRGVTKLEGEGMYTKTPKGVLMTCVKDKQINPLKAAIKQIDENAFIIVCDAVNVYGKGFNKIQ